MAPAMGTFRAEELGRAVALTRTQTLGAGTSTHNGSETHDMLIAIDMRFLHRALIRSPIGAVGGVGTFARALWLGLSRNYPQTPLIALVEHGPLPTLLRDLIEVAPIHHIKSVGLSGFIPRLDGRGRYIMLLRTIETELGIKMDPGGRPTVLHMIDHTPPPRPVGCATVCTIHEEPQPQPDSYFALLARMLQPASRVTAVGFVSQSVVAAYPDLAAKPSAVIYNGIDFDADPDGSAYPPHRAMEALRGRPYFMHVGLLDGRKNPIGVLTAMARVIRNSPEEMLLLSVGPYQIRPASLEALRSLAGRLGISDRLVVMDRGASPRELSGLYRHSLGLVFPSLTEAFGYPALEALACGTPCVVSSTGGLPEVVGSLGVIVDANDPDSIAAGMLRVRNGDGLRARVRAEGPRWARRFSSEAMARGYMTLYRRAMEMKAAQSRGLYVTD